MRAWTRSDATVFVIYAAACVLGVALSAREAQPPRVATDMNRCLIAGSYVTCPTPEAAPSPVTSWRMATVYHQGGPTPTGVLMTDVIENSQVCLFVTRTSGSDQIAQSAVPKKDLGGRCQ